MVFAKFKGDTSDGIVNGKKIIPSTSSIRVNDNEVEGIGIWHRDNLPKVSAAVPEMCATKLLISTDNEGKGY